MPSIVSPRPRFILVLLATGLLLALRATAAPADEKPADPQSRAKNLESIQVTGVTDVYTAKQSRAGTKTDTPLDEIPQAISVITAEQIHDQNAQTLQEALRYSAGVRTDQYGLDNRGDWFSLRGGSSGTTLLDGMRLPLTGYYGDVREEPYAFERIEILHGPSSVMAGQNAPGGVVNLVRKLPQAQAAHEIDVQAGTHDHRQLSADLTGPLNERGTLLYRLVALDRNAHTQVDYADEHRVYLAPSLTWKPGEASALTVYGEFQRDRSRNTNGFFPIVGTLRPNVEGRRIPLDRFVGEPDWDRYGGQRTRFGYAFAHAIDDTWSVRQDLRHDSVHGRFLGAYARFFPDDAGNVYLDPQQHRLDRLSYGSYDDNDITNADLLLEGKLGGERVQHTVLAGIDGMIANARQRVANDATCPVPFDVYAPDYGTCPAPVFDPATFTDTRIRQAGAIVQDQIKIDQRWVLVASARRDFVKTTTKDASGNETGRAEDRAWTRNLGAVYLVPGGWSPYLNYSESFQPVAGRGRDGAAFHPSRGKQAEAGLKWMPEGRSLSVTAALYKLRETGRLTPDPVDPSYSVQRGRVDAKGIELEANASVGRWDVIGAATHAKATDASTGFRFESIPENTASLWAIYHLAFLPGLRVGGGVRYVGKTWDGADDVVTPSNTLYDAMASYDTGAWRVSLNAVNLANKTYYATCLARGDCWFGTKRRVVAEVAYRW